MEQLRDHLDRLAVVMALALRRVWGKVSSLEARVATLEAPPAASEGEVEPIVVERLRREQAADRAVTHRIAEEVFGTNPGEGTGLRTIIKAIVGVQGTLRERLQYLAVKVADLRDEVYGDVPGTGVRCLIAELLGKTGNHADRIVRLELWRHDIERGDALQTAAQNAAADETASLQGQVDAVNGVLPKFMGAVREGTRALRELNNLSNLRIDSVGERVERLEGDTANHAEWQKVFAGELERLATAAYQTTENRLKMVEGRLHNHMNRIRGLEGNPHLDAAPGHEVTSEHAHEGYILAELEAFKERMRSSLRGLITRVAQREIEARETRQEVEALRGVVAGYQETFANILPRLAELEKSENRLLQAERAIAELKDGRTYWIEQYSKLDQRTIRVDTQVAGLRGEVFFPTGGGSRIQPLTSATERLRNEVETIKQAKEGGF